jgi:hypothetical protein
LVFLLGSIAFATGGVATSGFCSLTMPYTSYAASLSEACCSISGKIEGLQYNPASCATMKGKVVSFELGRMLANDRLLSLLYGKSYGKVVFGLALMFYRTDPIQIYSKSGQLIEKLGQKDTVLSLGLGLKPFELPLISSFRDLLSTYPKLKELFDLSFGLNVSFFSSNIFGFSANGFAVDWGIQFKLNNNINAGMSIQNLGRRIRFIEEQERLPTNLRFGLSYSRNVNYFTFLGCWDFAYRLNENDFLSFFGLEVKIVDVFSFRCGKMLNLKEKVSFNQIVSFGFGLRYKNFYFDYSAQLVRDLNLPYRIGIKINFDKE